MKDETGKLEQDVTSEQLNEARRRFVTTAGKAAVVAPAVGLLLSVEGAKAGLDGPYEIFPNPEPED